MRRTAPSSSAAMALRDAEFTMEHSLPVSLDDLDMDDEISECSSVWEPPAWRKTASGWSQRPHFPPPSSSLSGQSSPEYQSAGEGDDTLLPSNIPLPASPPKLTPRNSVEPPQHMHDLDSILSGGGHPPIKEESVAPETPSNNCE
jgi:hypothetical protein